MQYLARSPFWSVADPGLSQKVRRALTTSHSLNEGQWAEATRPQFLGFRHLLGATWNHMQIVDVKTRSR